MSHSQPDWQPPEYWESELLAHQAGGCGPMLVGIAGAMGAAMIPVAVIAIADTTIKLTVVAGIVALVVLVFVWVLFIEPTDRWRTYHFDPNDPDHGIYEIGTAPSLGKYWLARHLDLPPPTATIRIRNAE